MPWVVLFVDGEILRNIAFVDIVDFSILFEYQSLVESSCFF